MNAPQRTYCGEPPLGDATPHAWACGYEAVGPHPVDGYVRPLCRRHMQLLELPPPDPATATECPYCHGTRAVCPCGGMQAEGRHRAPACVHSACPYCTTHDTQRNDEDTEVA